MLPGGQAAAGQTSSLRNEPNAAGGLEAKKEGAVAASQNGHKPAGNHVAAPELRNEPNAAGNREPVP